MEVKANVRDIGSQAHGTVEELALMATLKRCDCGNDVVTMLEPCEVRCNACGDYWDGLCWEDAIGAWNEQMKSTELASEVIGRFV
jgi:hypothetical protein